MAYGSFIVGGGGTIPRIGDIVFTTVKDNSPAKRYKNTVWELVAQNRVPMGAGDGHEGGETVEAGLPNITGYAAFSGSVGLLSSEGKTSGCFTSGGQYANLLSTKSDGSWTAHSLDFSARASNPIYGASDTVQPSGYYFYFWRRVS